LRATFLWKEVNNDIAANCHFQESSSVVISCQSAGFGKTTATTTIFHIEKKLMMTNCHLAFALPANMQ